MKKKILFIMNSLNCGGAEKALISVLETMDYAMYEVDLFLFKHEGLFLSKIPSQVNLLEEPHEFKYFDMPIKTAFIDCLKKGKVNIALLRLAAGYIFKSEKNNVRCEQRVWKYLSKSMMNIDKKYDIAVGFLEKNPVYFCVDKVNSHKKIGFIHTHYDNLGMDPKIDEPYFQKLDYIVTVSEECVTNLKERFPMYSEKIKLIYNIVSPNMIKKMSMEEIDTKREGVTIVSVGRLHAIKGFDIAVEACKVLVTEGYHIKWYVIGDGEERNKLEKMIKEFKLQGIMILSGIKDNPYPYIKEADIYVQPSRSEGKSIAIDEAKILHKPIVVTNFSTAKDQIKNNDNGLIVEMNAISIYEGIKTIIDDEELRNNLVMNLSKEELGTESEIHKLYELFI